MTPTGQALDGVDSDWLRRMHILDQFEERWQTAGAARIEDFLPAEATVGRLELLLELIQIDLQYRWKSGHATRVEDYARQFPELGEPGQVSSSLIREELRLRRSCGCAASRDELAERFPDRIAEFTEATGTSQSGSISSPTTDFTTRGDSVPAIVADLRRLGRYELRETVGRGGFSVVYRAWDPELRRDVAVKVPRAELLEDPNLCERVLREARSAARLRHPAIVPIHEVGQENGVAFIVYEFLPGPTLARLLSEARPTPQQAAAWIARVAEALDYAHQCGVIHRDVKPANIMMDRDGQPMLADFGLAMHADAGATLTQQGDILGTPSYMSPEQAAGRGHDADARTDVYSLGVLLYESLCGQPPFQGSGASVLHRVIHDEPIPPRQKRSGIPLDLETICLKAIAKEPARRYATAGAMALDLRLYLESRPIRARRIGPIGQLVRWCRRKPAVAATIALATIVSLAVGAISVWRVVRERDRAVSSLYESLVREARAIRFARASGYRTDAWLRLEQAARLKTASRDVESLRHEAVACMGDFVGLDPMIWSGWKHPAYAVAIALSRDGKRVALGFTDGTVAVRDTTSGAEIARLKDHHAGVFALTFTRDGRTLISMDDDGTIKAWTASASDEFNCSRTIATASSAEPGRVQAVSVLVTSDGNEIIACSKGQSEVSTWSLADGAPGDPFRTPGDEPIETVELSPDGNLLTAAYKADGREGVLVWDVSTRQLVRELKPGVRNVWYAAFSPNGELLACAGADGVDLFETSEFRRQTFMRIDRPFNVAFSPDSRMLAIPSHEFGVVRLWDVSVNREVAVLNHPEQPLAVVFSPDGNDLISVAAGTVHVWRVRGNREKLVLAGHVGVVTDLAFSPDGKQLASSSGDATVRIWDAATGNLLSTLPSFRGPVQNLAFHPDGTMLAIADHSGAIQIWDTTGAEAPTELITLDRERGANPLSVAFSPDGHYLAAAGGNGIDIWRVIRGPLTPSPSPRSGERGEELPLPSREKELPVTSRETELPLPSGGEGRGEGASMRVSLEQVVRPTTEHAGSLSFSRDGRLLSWIDFLGVCHLWDLQNSLLLPTSPIRGGIPLGTAFLPDSLRLATTGNDASPEIWDVVAGQRVSSFTVPTFASDARTFAGRVLALSSDGARLALQGSSVTIWDTERQKLLLALPKEQSAPWSLAWSPNRELLAVGTADGSVVIWNLPEIRSQLDKIGLGW